MYARNVRLFWGCVLNLPSLAPPLPPLLSLSPSQILEFVGLREKLSQSLNFANTLVDMNLLETLTTIHRYTPTPHTSHFTHVVSPYLTPHISHLTYHTSHMYMYSHHTSHPSSLTPHPSLTTIYRYTPTPHTSHFTSPTCSLTIPHHHILHITPHTCNLTIPHPSHTPHPSHLTPHPSHLTLHTSPLTPHPSHLTPHPSHLTLHTSHLTLHPSHLTPHPSPLTPHTSPFTPHPSPSPMQCGKGSSVLPEGVVCWSPELRTSAAWYTHITHTLLLLYLFIYLLMCFSFYCSLSFLWRGGALCT